MKIMFICHGNICRSPMAEIIMRDMVDKAGLGDSISCSSCATSSEEIGNSIYPPAQAELKRHGLYGLHRAVQLRKSDYDAYDIFIAMDDKNVRNILRIFGGDPQNKVRKLLDRDVSDPWYTDRFDIAYEDIRAGCSLLLKSLCDRTDM